MKTFHKNMRRAFVVCVLLTAWSAAQRRSLFSKRCDIKSDDFTRCLTAAVPEAIRRMKDPWPSLGMPSLDPLAIPEISVTPGGGIANFFQNYTNVRLMGFRNIQCLDININLEEKVVFMDCMTPRFLMESDYYFSGTVSIVPIYGNGTARIILDQVRCLQNFHLERIYKGGQMYLKAVNSTFDIRPGHITFHFENLYDGNKLLGDSVNRFMNENWKEVFDDMKPSYEEAYSIIFEDLFNRVFSRVPLSKIFINAV